MSIKAIIIIFLFSKTAQIQFHEDEPFSNSIFILIRIFCTFELNLQISRSFCQSEQVQRI